MIRVFFSAALWVCGGVAALAQTYDGLCFQGNECTGPVPITDGTFFTCEENCVMEEATPVRGMDAFIFDVTCRGDSGTYSYRMIMSRVMTSEGLATFAITNDSITPLMRCPQ
jgi:hypothetical protein